MDKYLIEPSFVYLFFLFSPSPFSPPPSKHTQPKYAELDISKPDKTGEAPDTSGKVPEAEPPVLYSTVKTED